MENLDAKDKESLADNGLSPCAIALLAKNPSLGRPGRIIGTRELIVNKIRNLVPYRVRNESIEILRIFHTSRKLPKSW